MDQAIINSSNYSNMYSKCPYPRCQTYMKARSPGHETACENALHHLLVMSQRFCKASPQNDNRQLWPFHSVDVVNGTEKCAFTSCEQNSLPSLKCWCSNLHHLLWIQSFCSLLDPRQKCKLDSCFKHAFVIGENGSTPLRVYDFCCWSHSQQHSMSLGLQRQACSSVEDSSCNSEPSSSTIVSSLKAYVHNKTKPSNSMVIDECFFNKHPWEFFSEPGKQTCWIIAKCRKDRNGRLRQLKTKDGYHWKQQGRITDVPIPGCDQLVTRYRTYVKQKGKTGDGEQDCNSKFSMTEYCLKDSTYEDYCVVKLGKAKCIAPGYKTNKRKRNQQPMLAPVGKAESADSFDWLACNTLEDSFDWLSYYT